MRSDFFDTGSTAKRSPQVRLSVCMCLCVCARTCGGCVVWVLKSAHRNRDATEVRDTFLIRQVLFRFGNLLQLNLNEEEP